MEKITDTIVQFAYNDLKLLLIILVIFTIISSVLIYLLTSPFGFELHFIYSNWIIDISAGLAAFSAFILLTRERIRKSIGKKYISLFIGILLWLSAEIIYTYYQTVLKVDIPYPSYADIFWFLGYIFVGYHLYSAFHFWNQNKKLGENLFFITVIFTALLVNLLVQTSVMSYSNNIYLISVDILYHVLDGAILIPSFILLWSLRFDHPLFIHRSLISLFVILNTFGNIGYIFSFNLGQNIATEFAWIWDIIYNFSYILLAGSLIWYDKLSDIINKKIEQNMIINGEKQFQYLIEKQNKHEIVEKNPHILKDKEKIIKDSSIMHTLVKNSKFEILLLILSQNHLHYYSNAIKALNLELNDFNIDNENIVKIQILFDSAYNLKPLVSKDSAALSSNIIYRKISKSLEYDIIAILIDRQNLIMIDLKNYRESDDDEEFFAIYSTNNNNNIVQQFYNLFESLWILSELKEQTANNMQDIKV